jgi:hypothetical protein
VIPINQDLSTPSFRDPKDYDLLQKVFEAVGYTNEGVLEILRVKDFPSIKDRDLPLLLHLTNHGTPLEILIRLFLMEVPVEAEPLRKAIHPMKLETWLEAGLVKMTDDVVVTKVKLLPFQNLLVAFDLDKRLYSSSGYDYVMGIGKSSLTLANITVRRRSRMSLDLGTGCGIQALFASSHSDRILAVDRNPRAIGFTTFNARLNGLSSIDCLEGDLFEPVKGESFDLIISNPPFVISPEMSYIYRDSGMEGDVICQKIVREAPHFLREGGYCQFLANWAESSDQDWRERLAKWFEGTGCDVWVMRTESQLPATYASIWIRHTERQDVERYPERFEKWMAYYEKQGIESIGLGMITMRRSSGHKNRIRADESPGNMTGPCGDSVLQAFELGDFIESVDDEALLQMHFRFSPDVRLEQQSSPSMEGWKEEEARIHLIKGFTYTGNVDPYVSRLIIGCNGERPLKELLSEMASSLGVNPVTITPHLCEMVRRLIEQGFLLPLSLTTRNP